jgi:pimeloyl-ACP methyl ester carboxylesterase
MTAGPVTTWPASRSSRRVDARLELIDDAGHLPQLEQAERTAAVVTAFLAQ